MRALRNEAGETLVETLATVAILGLAVVAILGALGTATRTSDVTARGADAVVVVTLAAEAVKGVTGLTCATLSADDFDATIAALTGLPRGWSPANVTVTDAGCVAAASGAPLPRVTIRAVAPRGGMSESLVVAPRLS